ncbi:tryptophan-rich sensory protein [Subsaximicrobium wynnwilliamsii]|uniref:Tryptophan-rich sensory protein n=1 Tax=Subsaximicrobium wynnwilliamsii TaxID=291179 RepID=A0A5C6ZII5_9FLAO|nr:tryptophan-rich sensory protein [Subsaximicrobium wynnwilliamsii]TXD82785.1 tryptophan-rich sensory protein [Subsaximicrobium wynnwilliamsii]TXD88509.1 tryptophan-rich sensory protein [Subsaximicrobium wynnwilliamsii]TXE02495.1 tryptophan-rich sensory protein [Subsaximicrobium wynnwilliamsii]
MKKVLQIANGIALVSTIFINYLSNTGAINGTTIGQVSNDMKSLFTPAGYAFAIWGFIYLLLIGFIVYQGRSLFVKVRDDDFVLRIGWTFVISCVANSAWVFCFLYGYTGLSCVFIFLLLLSLLKIVIDNSMELWDAPMSVIAFLWWPFVFYSGWVTVASIANVSAYLVKTGWDGFGISAVTWTLIMIGVALIVNLAITWKRNMREFALVGAWALVAIAYANYEKHDVIVYSAALAAAILVISSGIHGAKNKDTNPFNKCKEYLQNKA